MLRSAFFLAVLMMSVVANGANMISVTGPAPFGFANQIELVEGWNQTATYLNVSISMPLADRTIGGPIGGVQGTIYLMNQIGPGTTAANQVAPPVSISGLTDVFTTRTVFSGLTLYPGNYYLVWVSTSGGGLSMSPEGSSTPVVTPGVGITPLGVGASIAPDAFPPATSVTLGPVSNLFIDVSGDLVAPSSAVPTLGMVGLAILLLGMGGAALFVLRRQRA